MQLNYLTNFDSFEIRRVFHYIYIDTLDFFFVHKMEVFKTSFYANWLCVCFCFCFLTCFLINLILFRFWSLSWQKYLKLHEFPTAIANRFHLGCSQTNIIEQCGHKIDIFWPTGTANQEHMLQQHTENRNQLPKKVINFKTNKTAQIIQKFVYNPPKTN